MCVWFDIEGNRLSGKAALTAHYEADFIAKYLAHHNGVDRPSW